MGKRLNAERVKNIRMSEPKDLQRVELTDLCDSHEVYRAFAQRFIDIYSGRAAKTQDEMEFELFSLFLAIVGPVPPKV